MSTPSEEEARAALTEIINDGMADRGNRVNEWPEDEAAAYRIDGWAAGAARARSLQVSKTVDRVMSWLASRVSTPPSEDARISGLREAADIADRMYAGTDGSALEKAWIGGCMATASAIRNRVQEIEVVPPVPAVPVPPREAPEPACALPGHQGCEWFGAILAHHPAVPRTAPTESETLAPMSPVFEDALTDDEWVERRLAAPTEPECWCSDVAQSYGLTDPGCPRHDPAPSEPEEKR